jgi:MoaA/NifB/PqqE/SkfB family radical SAM enzyme
MCDIWKRKDGEALHYSELHRHRESINVLGVQHVVLTGGEPLLNRELDEICDFFRGMGIRITLLTTGLLLGKRVQSVVNLIDNVIISIDGPPLVHDEIRRVPGAFATVQKGIMAVRHHRPEMPISVRTTVQKLNHCHLKSTISAVKSLSVNQISFLASDISSAAFNREERWSHTRQNEVMLTRDELVTLEYEIESVITTFEDDIRDGFIAENSTKLRRIAQHFREHLEGLPSKAPLCNAPWVSAVLDLDGSVRPCFFHAPIGNINRATLEEAVNSTTALNFRSTLDVANNATCQRCVCSLNYR